MHPYRAAGERRRADATRQSGRTHAAVLAIAEKASALIADEMIHVREPRD
jgi:hypothetical protein